MILWVTPKGDRWLCEECKKEMQEIIDKEKWRPAINKWDPMLRCYKCRHGDVEILD